MPQYDDSFLIDCEKRKNVRSYKFNKHSNNVCNVIVTNGSGDCTNGKNGKQQRKRSYLLKRYPIGAAAPLTVQKKSLLSTLLPPPQPMGIYRSVCSLINNSTFNCKF